MMMLALEFSSARRSVALARNGIVLSEAVEQTGGRGTNALGLIETVLAGAKASREEIEAIAVGLGPGSYTGIRAAIAVAQGWQLARGVKLLGVSSAEAIAAQAQAEKIFGRVNVVIDAQRGEFYLVTWEVSPAGCREISPLKIVAGAGLDLLKSAGEICVGPEQERQLFPPAALLALLASGRSGFAAGEKLEPIYLRETNFVKALPPNSPLV
ncbi:MAG: tRNA (adenosine(37)-N6)-threonylcarbamoyltransferase complex dimerization subunit type 1 TsaB [Verrucomicrobiota bacterium]